MFRSRRAPRSGSTSYQSLQDESYAGSKNVQLNEGRGRQDIGWDLHDGCNGGRNRASAGVFEHLPGPSAPSGGSRTSPRTPREPPVFLRSPPTSILIQPMTLARDCQLYQVEVECSYCAEAASDVARQSLASRKTTGLCCRIDVQPMLS